MRDMFVETLLDIAKADKNVHLLTGDLGFGVLKPFFDELPNQITNVGIAEQNMTGFATGMALEGKIVFTYSIGNFPTLRTLEQIRNDAAYHEANVKIVSIGGGFAYGALGMSHHATEDLAIMRALPNVSVFSPGDLIETKYATKAIYNTKGTCYLRLGRGGGKKIHDDSIKVKIGKPIKVVEGEKIAILTTGAILEEGLKAVEMLNEKNIFPSLYSFPNIKPLEVEAIKDISLENEILFTVEEHNISGGFGSAISEILNSYVRKNRIVMIGINDTYSSVVGNQEYLREFYGLSASKIFSKVIEEINRIDYILDLEG